MTDTARQDAARAGLLATLADVRPELDAEALPDTVAGPLVWLAAAAVELAALLVTDEHQRWELGRLLDDALGIVRELPAPARLDGRP